MDKRIYEIGNIVVGKVTNIKDYGAFIQLEDKTSGLLHISEIADKFIRDINHYLKLHEEVTVQVIDIDREKNFLHFSMRKLPKRYRKYPPKRFDINELDIDFTSLQKELPEWVKNTIDIIDKMEDDQND
ncbi:MAG: S1 RNA-binding domain-containing protein [Bacilli bacterium]